MVGNGSICAIPRIRRNPKRVKAAAYAYADGGPISREVLLLAYIDRFGVDAVMGRQLGAGEMRRMTVAENIVKAYRSRAKADNWAEWANLYPDLNRILEDAMLAVEDGD